MDRLELYKPQARRRQPNVFIGNVANFFPTKQDLAPRLSLNSNQIENYKTLNNNIACTVKGNIIPDFQRYNDQGITNEENDPATYITYFIDLSGNAMQTETFEYNFSELIGQLKFVYLPEITSIPTGGFNQRNGNIITATPKANALGGSVLDDNVFKTFGSSRIPQNELYCDISLSNNNNGNPDGDIQTLLANGGSVNYVAQSDRIEPSPATITPQTIGGTYAKLSISEPTHPNNFKYALVFVDGFFNGIFDINNVYARGLPPNSLSPKIKIILADEFFNISNFSNQLQITTPQIDTAALFTNAVAYLKLNNTNTEFINGYTTTDVGTLTRDGEWTNYGTNESYVELADQDDYSFVDAQGNNTDFVIKTEVIIDGYTDFPRFVSKRESSLSGVQEWEFFYNQKDGFFGFRIYDFNGNNFPITFGTSFTFGQKHILGVTLNGNTLSLFVDGQIIATETIPSGFQFFNGNSPVKLGNETFTSDLNLQGRQKETTIIKGQGWSAGEISDNYNNGNGVTI